MVDDAARYLGFAFASADLLFELDGEGVVSFALGAAHDRWRAWIWRPWRASALRDIVAEEDQAIVDAFLKVWAGDRAMVDPDRPETESPDAS